ncbi:MAG: BrnT family toxin [Rickettsiales bacterium]
MYDSEYNNFEWDPAKDSANQEKHGLSFTQATEAFVDPRQVVIGDPAHSCTEERFYCFGLVGNRVATVRFTLRGGIIRIIGAGYWRYGRAYYEKINA